MMFFTRSFPDLSGMGGTGAGNEIVFPVQLDGFHPYRS